MGTQAKRQQHPLATLTLADQNCIVAVENATPSAERRHLTVTCASKTVLSYLTEDHLLDMSRNSSDGTRIIVRWEGTGLFHVTILNLGITELGTQVRIVFDQSSRTAPEILAAPDVILAFGEESLKGDTFVPTTTDLLRWDGGQYKLAARWKWNDEMNFNDRFCVLDPKVLSCPATSLPLK